MSKPLVPVTPEQDDQLLLDDLARRINSLARGAALDFAYAVGELVIRELYGGSIAVWGEVGTRRSSYRRLAARSDLFLSPSALCRAVGVYALCERHGGKTAWPRLSVSHLQEVLMLEPPEQVRLLKTADAERWTVARLRSEIGKQGQRPRRQRNILKTVRELHAFIEERAGLLYESSTVGQLDGSDLNALSQAVALLRNELERLDRALLDPAGAPKAATSNTMPAGEPKATSSTTAAQTSNAPDAAASPSPCDVGNDRESS
jgi:hypothetical protein